jgi:hypothetical protein
MTSRNPSGPRLAPEAKVWVSGGWDRVEDEAEGTKTCRKKDKKVPLPTLLSQASSNPLFEQEVSAICDLIFELFS